MPPRIGRRLTRYLPHLASLTIILVTLAVTLAIDSAWRSERAKEQHMEVATAVDAARDRLERAMFSRVLLARNFVGYLENNPNLTDRDFRLMAADLVKLEQGILGVRLARGNVVSHLYPLEGRVHLQGRPLTDTLPVDGAQALPELIKSGATLVTSPVEAPQQRRVFLYMNPVYLTVVGLGGSAGPYWGMAVFELDLPQILEEAGITHSGPTPLSVRMGPKADKLVILGKESDFQGHAITAELAAPWGHWELAAPQPVALPWRKAPWLLGLAVALVLGFTTWLAAHQLLERIRTQERYRELVDNARSVILRVTPGGVITFFNEYATEFFGFTEDEVLGKHLLQTIVPPKDSKGRDQETGILEAMASPEEHVFRENENVTKDGRRVWMSWANRPLTGLSGDLEEVLCVGTDITARRAMEARLREMAVTDPLTGVSNRRQFFEKAEVELLRSRRYERPLSALLLDLDRFKTINDTHGHDAGDKVLVAVTKMVASRLRDVDLLGRMGGEEFAVLFPETDTEQALQVAERMRELVEQTEVEIGDGLGIGVTMSIGVASLGPNDRSVDALIRRADQAMYKAKQAGRNRVMAAR